MSDDSDTLDYKGQCPKCGHEKTLAVYMDQHSHCFYPGCGYFTRPTGDAPKLKLVADNPEPAFGADRGDLVDPDWSHPLNREGLTKRRLKAETLRKLGIFIGPYSGSMMQFYPYYSQDGDLVAQKVRTPSKDFPVVKGPGYQKLGQCLLFGQHYWGDRYDRQLVILEGELDAASVAQETGFKTAVVSIGTGAGNAAEHLKANYLWIDRFTEIILWFDNDTAGKAATEECAKLFKVGKVRIATATGFQSDGTTPCKDASDILQAARPGDIQACLYAAKAWRPRGIVNAKDNLKDVFAPDTVLPSYSYPPMMPKLQEMTGGMFPGDVIYHVAGTGVGKSTNIREIIYHLIEQGVKVCVMSFEDTVRDIKMGIMSIPASERLHLRPVPLPDDLPGRAQYDAVMRKWHEAAFGSGLAELFDPETAEWSMEAIMGYGRYAAKALDCKVCVVEPISFVASGIDLKADERRVLDAAAGEFAKNAKELGLSYLISHHLRRTSQGVPHEEGAPTSLNELRSSGGLANFATGVIGWERNNQAEGDGWRVTRSRIIKPIRRTGRSGIADTLYYGDDGRLKVSPLPFPPIGKPEVGDGSGNNNSKGFKPDY